MAKPSLLAVFFLWAVGMPVYAQTDFPAEVNRYMKPLKAELDARFRNRAENHVPEGLELIGLTEYTYNDKNELLQENAVNGTVYTRIVYRNDKRVEVTVVVDKIYVRDLYDTAGRVREHHRVDLLRGSNNQRSYRYETEQRGDSSIFTSYTDERMTGREVSVHDPVGLKTEIWKYYGDPKPSSKTQIFLSKDKKLVLSELYTDYSHKFSTSVKNTYTPGGLLLQSTRKDQGTTTVSKYSYNDKGAQTKCETFTNGKLSAVDVSEYDADGRLLKESGLQDGKLRYVNRYEYDQKGNKVLFLAYQPKATDTDRMAPGGN